MTLIAAENLDVSFGRAQVLFGVSLKIERGEIVTIVGPNGSGKSTLLRSLIGAQRPTAGRILKEAGLRMAYLQFDGVTNEANSHRKIGNLYDVKLRAIEELAAAGIDVILVVTVVNGVNNDMIGPIIQFAIENADKVTDKAVADFFNKNKARFATPATRDLRVILTKTQASAAQAKAALQRGQSWGAVAKRFSIDQASKDQGGTLLGIAKGTQEKSFDDAIFAAKKGELTGPVKTQFGYYVFEVQKVTKPRMIASTSVLTTS